MRHSLPTDEAAPQLTKQTESWPVAEADAIGAYTQVMLEEFAKKFGFDVTETWISLPRSMRPKGSDKTPQKPTQKN